MPKAGKKFYAVSIGKQGPKIYNTWDECKENTSRFPGAKHKSFPTLQQAQEWLAVSASHSSPTASHSQNKPPHAKQVYLIHDSDSDVEFIDEPSTTKSHPVENATYQDDSDIEIIENHAPKRIPSALAPTSPISGPSPSAPMSSFTDLSESPSTSDIPISGSPLPHEPSPSMTEAVPEVEIKLSPEQSQVLKRVRDGESVFFTGSAGTGKSVLLREIIKLRGGSASRYLGITASTGIAAVNIGGCTLHSWAGIGLGQEDVEKYVGKFFGNKNLRQVKERWLNVETLIIDEISMLDGELFDKLEQIARRMRNNNLPFGGIQLVLSGDFSQLPPVPGRPEPGKPKSEAKFAFNAVAWNRCIGSPVTLTKVFRQKDQEFVDLLNDMRFGRVSDHALRVFQGLSAPRNYSDGIEPAELYPMRYQVDNANKSRLDALPDSGTTYAALDLPGQDSEGRPVSIANMQKALERMMAPKNISLKVGAQVMLIKNLQQGVLVNGSIGQVVRFCTASDALKDGLQIGRNEPGGDRWQPPEQDPAVKSLPRERLWPVVRFINKKEVFCIPLDFTVEGPGGYLEAKRVQIPLILAWAISIHKSQGQTLERVKVDLGRVFECGQAYVALSRATSLQGLQVVHFDPVKVMAHPAVLAWYEQNERDAAERMEHEHDPFDEDDEEAMRSYHGF